MPGYYAKSIDFSQFYQENRKKFILILYPLFYGKFYSNGAIYINNIDLEFLFSSILHKKIKFS